MNATPHYGIDGPGIMHGLLWGGLAGLVFGAVAFAYISSPAADLLDQVVVGCSVVSFCIGLGMLSYSLRGKLGLRDWLLTRHAWRGDEVVLDVGAGRGLMAVGAAKRVPRGRVIAVDIWRRNDLSGNGPDALATNARLEGVYDRIEVITCDARKLKLPDASVDVVVSVLCLHNIANADGRIAACREIARVLKPGGRALIADYIRTPSYARAFRRMGLSVRGPLNAMMRARGIMWLVDVRKPGTGVESLS